jgi:hypothetical protein
LAGIGSKNGGLSYRQIRAIETLLAEPTIAAAAASAGVSERTLFRWLNSSDFAAAYKKARERLLEDAVATLQRASADAAQCLHTIVKDEKVSVYARLTAAKSILELAFKARDLEIDERLAGIEAFLQAGGPRLISRRGR